MAKIPFYEDRLTPQGGLNVQDRAVEVSGAMGAAMQNLGNAGANAAGLLQKMDDDNAIANASKPLSEMPGWASNRLTELATNARDGGYVDMPDGKAMTLTEAMRKEWDDASSKMLSGIENPKAKLFAQKQLDSTWGTLFSHTVATEHSLFQKNKTDAANVSIANFAKTAAGDDTLAPKLLQDANDTIDRIGLPEHERNIAKLTARKTIVEAAVTGAIQRNAPEVAQALKDKYGVTNTEVSNPPMAKLAPAMPTPSPKAAKRLGISASDLTAVISYETGGKFDPSIRGGKDDKHIGLIQFGENEQRQYGANQKQTFAEQMVAVREVPQDRGVKPGDDLKTLYKIINGGNRNVSDNASDGNGTIAEHVAKIAKEHGGNAASRIEVRPVVADLVGELEASRLHTFLSEGADPDQQAADHLPLAARVGRRRSHDRV